MGCGASTAVVAPERLREDSGKASVSVPLIQDLILDYAGHLVGNKSDQDRLTVRPISNGTALFVGIFDGHFKPGGEEVAADAATNLPRLLEKVRKKDPGGAVEAALKESFAQFQASRVRKYEPVKKKVLKLKAAMEKETGVEMPCQWPQDAGTTATVAVADGAAVAASALPLAAVGDSRAVVAVAADDGSLSAVAVTTDHDSGNAAEKARAEAGGGVFDERHVAHNDAEGMIETLRSLGDVPFHECGVLTSEPECHSLPVTPRTAFLILASDGVWKGVSNQAAVDVVASHLFAAASPYRASPTPQALLAAARALAAHATAAQPAARFKDDVSVALLTFAPYWTRDDALPPPPPQAPLATAEAAAAAGGGSGSGGGAVEESKDGPAVAVAAAV